MRIQWAGMPYHVDAKRSPRTRVDLSRVAPASGSQVVNLNCIQVGATGESVVEQALRLNALTRSRADVPFDIRDAEDCPVARVHSMWQTTLKCVCRKHKTCNLMLLVSWYGEQDSLLHIVNWAALASTTSENEHWALAQKITRDGKALATASRASLTTK